MSHLQYRLLAVYLVFSYHKAFHQVYIGKIPKKKEVSLKLQLKQTQ